MFHSIAVRFVCKVSWLQYLTNGFNSTMSTFHEYFSIFEHVFTYFHQVVGHVLQRCNDWKRQLCFLNSFCKVIILNKQNSGRRRPFVSLPLLCSRFRTTYWADKRQKGYLQFFFQVCAPVAQLSDSLTETKHAGSWLSTCSLTGGVNALLFQEFIRKASGLTKSSMSFSVRFYPAFSL